MALKPPIWPSSLWPATTPRPSLTTTPSGAKYGAPIAARARIRVTRKPNSRPPPTCTTGPDYGTVAANRGTSVDSLLKRGLQLAVCSTATHNFAGVIAAKAGGNADAIYAELTANLLSNSHMVPAGIVTVSRAQERGYTLVTS